MEASRLRPSHDPLKVSKFVALPEKLTNFCVLSMRAGLLICLVASISLALHSAFFSGSTRRFQLPDRTGPGRDVPAPEDDDPGPTNISHLFFGIGASVNTWRERSKYVELWWDRKRTRGCAWLDGEPKRMGLFRGPVPYRVSRPDWTRFKYSSSQAAVRIARIVVESFRVGAPRVRWFVMGDDDTVFFADNLVSVLAGFDHRQMYYIGGNSESVEQDALHAYDMAFGGGGFAISYPLAARLADALNACLNRYFYFYGSDQRIWACIDEIGAALTLHRGFHQLDIRGDPYGLLAAHPLVPLVSLHHLDYLDPIIPEQTRLDSVKTLMKAYRVDPRRILHQCFCYNKTRQWSVSISWGYTMQIYPFMVAAHDLRTPLQTFKTWRSSSDGPFTFNTRPMSPDPCQQPVVYFLDRVEELGGNATLTSYEMFVAKQAKVCIKEEYQLVRSVRRVEVTSMKMDDDYWKKAPVRQCCDIKDNGSVNKGTMRIRIRKCRPWELITA